MGIDPAGADDLDGAIAHHRTLRDFYLSAGSAGRAVPLLII
ncbi:hypothetical protein [Virgisporangium aliadipatigenens]|nr:hypothetical protein [Virgisporangium aliadipatigenens]